ncbi:MAG: hypothetical protein AAFY28_22895, partial [Actinomycetota bacterium]
MALLLAATLGAIFAPLIAPHDPYASSRSVMTPPVWSDGGTWNHILGTDGQGRDRASHKVPYGSRLLVKEGDDRQRIGIPLKELVTPRHRRPIADMQLRAIAQLVAGPLDTVVVDDGNRHVSDGATVARGDKL